MSVAQAQSRGWQPRVCRNCSAPITPQQLVTGGLCKAPACEAYRRRELVRKDFLRREESRHLEQTAAFAVVTAEVDAVVATLDLSEGDVLRVAVPFIGAPQEPLPEARRMAFLDHLDTVIATAFGEPAVAPDAEDRAERDGLELPEPAAATAGCATCRGKCCKVGATSMAFLMPADIQRLRLEDPNRTAPEIRALYVDRLPETGTAGSCVFHGPLGCTLERGLRNDICNRYRCHELTVIDQALTARPARHLAVLAQTEGVPQVIATLDLAIAAEEGFGPQAYVQHWEAGGMTGDPVTDTDRSAAEGA
jgi:hypothetical protein